MAVNSRFVTGRPRMCPPNDDEAHEELGGDGGAIETGSDFQNRMLRSLRSAYRQSSR